MENTLTGVILPDIENRPETSKTKSAVTKINNSKSKLTILGSTTALLIALGTVFNHGAELSQSITDWYKQFHSETTEWTDDKAVVIEPREGVSTLTIEICDSGLETGESMHIAFLLGRDKSDLPETFVLKKKGCRGETGRVWMNPGDFKKYVTQPHKADFKLSYTRAHLHSLDQLLNSAMKRCNAGV
ncbi:MAG: hypothetical protein WBP02_06295 [Gammaproteobacteria bacterium]|jgi:hypothetical protein